MTHHHFVILRTLVRRISWLSATISNQLHCMGFFGLRPQNDSKKMFRMTENKNAQNDAPPLRHPEDFSPKDPMDFSNNQQSITLHGILRASPSE